MRLSTYFYRTLFFVIFFGIMQETTFAQVIFQIPNILRPRDSKTKPKTARELLEEEAKNPELKQKREDDEASSMGNDMLRYYSHGWLATPFPAYSIYFHSSTAWIINDANNINFPALPRINSTFSPRNPYPDNELRKPLPRRTSLSNDTTRIGDYVDSEYNDINLIMEIAMPIPLMLRLGVGYAHQRAVLFADDRSFNGLAPDGSGRLIPLREYHTLDMQEHFVTGILGFKIPIYGAFADLFDQRISSYYYLYLGAQGQYNVFNRAIQHAQLFQPGTDFRYGTRGGIGGEIINGTDTLQVWNAAMPTLRQWRIQPEIAIGWGLSGEINIFGFNAGLATMLEVFGTLPYFTVTEDTAWRQYVVGFRAAIGWHRRL